eukprot:117655-Pyramimonas_sp.AAC.1
MDALLRRLPQAGAQLEALKQVAAASAAESQPQVHAAKSKSDLEREREARRLAVASRKAGEALTKALDHEADREKWLADARAE